MPPQSQPLTDEQEKVILDRFQALLDRKGKPRKWAVSSIGKEELSETTLSEIMSGTYAGNRDRYIRMIAAWTDRQIIQEDDIRPAGYVTTGIATAMESAVSWAIRTSSIVVITGPNGCGKSTALQYFKVMNPGAIYVLANSASRSSRPQIESIAKALRMGRVRVSASQLFDQVAGFLAGTNRPIFIDEVHKLCSWRGDDALHLLRDLHDATGCPMVWAGNGKIVDYIRAGKTDGHDPLEQIFGRVSMWLDLTERATGGADGGERLYTLQDIQRVFAASKVRLSPDAGRYLLALANDASFGCLRAAKFLVSMAAIVARGEVITSDLLRSIQRQRLGRRSAELVELQIGEAAKAVA